MWINLYVLIFIFTIIFIAKFFQYFRRWGVSRERSIDYLEKTLNIQLEGNTLTVEFTQLNPKKSTEKLSRIVVFTPYFSSNERFLYFATALALNSYEVVLIESRSLLRNSKIMNFQFIIENIMDKLHPTTIIANDVYFPLLFPLVEKTRINYIFIRPLMDEQDYSLFKNIPFSSRWFLILWIRISTIFARIIKPNIPINENYFSGTEVDKVLLLTPKYPNIQNKIHKNSKIVVNRIPSPYSFKGYETLGFSVILNFLSTSSF